MTPGATFAPPPASGCCGGRTCTSNSSGPCPSAPQAMEALLRGRTCPMGTVLRLRPHEALWLGGRAHPADGEPLRGHGFPGGRILRPASTPRGASSWWIRSSQRGTPPRPTPSAGCSSTSCWPGAWKPTHLRPLPLPRRPESLGYAPGPAGFPPGAGAGGRVLRGYALPGGALLQDVFLHIKEPQGQRRPESRGGGNPPQTPGPPSPSSSPASWCCALTPSC